MKLPIKSIIVLIIFLIIGCGHSNELAKYNVAGAKIYVKETIRPKAKSIRIEEIKDYSESDKKKEEEKSDDVLSVLSSIGKGIIAEDKREELINAVDTRMLLASISEQLKESMDTYLNVTWVENISDSPDYICEINLEDCKLQYNQSKVAVFVNSNAKFIERASGEIAWEDTESRSISLSEHYNNSVKDKALKDVLGILQLSSLDNEKVNRIVGDAASDVGLYMAETLREDIAEANQEKKEKD